MEAWGLVPFFALLPYCFRVSLVVGKFMFEPSSAIIR